MLLRWHVLATALCAALMLGLSVSGEQVNETSDPQPEIEAATAEVSPVTLPVYLVPYSVGETNVSTLLSVTNLGSTSCTTSVNWKSRSDTVACTTTLTLRGGSPVGETRSHCTHRAMVGCDATCPQPEPHDAGGEGMAIVRTEARCRDQIVVDASTYDQNTRLDLVGAADLRVVRLPPVAGRRISR